MSMNAEGCLSVSAKTGRPLERFCKRGHDTEAVGRIRKGWCKACADIADAAGGVGGKQKPGHSPGWHRDRVNRWLEIITDDPMDEPQGTHARLLEFETRYARLETEVPTP